MRKYISPDSTLPENGIPYSGPQGITPLPVHSTAFNMSATTKSEVMKSSINKSGRLFAGFLAFVTTLFFSVATMAQTTLISPSGDGGFETAPSIAGNNWQVVNSGTNQWQTGTVPGVAFYTGARCAYISNDGGTSWAFTQTVTASHLYRDITVPAGESKITLSFDWAALGETSSWDAIMVHTCPTTLTPVAGSPTGTANAPSWSGSGTATLVGSQLWNSATKQTVTVSLPSSLAGTTFRLVITWKNDGSGGLNPPAAIDNVSLTSALPATITSAQTGNWTSTSTWVGGVVPSGGDNAIIDATHTVTIDASSLSITNLTVNNGGTLNYGTTPSSFSVNGNLTVSTGGVFNVAQGTTGKTLVLAGNLTNDGNIDLSQTSALLNLTSANVQTISGTGTFPTGMSIRSITFNNTNPASPNINWGFNNITVPGTITFTAGRVDLNGNTLILGTNSPSIAAGTLSYTAGGFRNGTFRKWLATSTLATSINTTTTNWPFFEGLNSRSFFIAASSAITTAGWIEVSHTPTTGFTTVSVADGAYTIDRQYNASWTVATGGGLAGGTFLTRMNGEGILTTATAPGTNIPRAMKGAGVVNTHISGTGTTAAPQANRSAVASANLAGAWSIGINTTDAGVFSVQSGNWSDGSTWSGGVAPTASNAVTITTGHTVTVNAAGAVAGTVLINGTLTVSSGTLDVTASTSASGVTMGTNGILNINGGTTTVGTGSTRFSTLSTASSATSQLNVTAGTLNINGNLLINSSSIFTQSGGTINVDGNAAGVTTNSVASGTHLVNFASNALTITGGNLNIIDPHAATSTTTYAFRGAVSSATNIGIGHTTTFGDGVSTDPGGSANGFYIYTFASSSYLQLGNVVALGGTGAGPGSNRHVSTTSSVGINGSLTVGSNTNTNSEFRLGTGTVYVAGDITVNTGNALTTSGTTLYLGSFAAGTAGPTTVAQTIGGGGAFRNSSLSSSSTANFGGLTINNTSTGGVTFSGNALLTPAATAFGGSNINNSGTVSGTLTLVAGNVSTGSGTFILGVTGTTGSLSYTAGGFTGGSTFARQYAATTTGTTITAAGVPSSTATGSYPFISGTNSRFFYIERPVTTGATNGAIAVKFTGGTGFTGISPIVDGAYTVDQRSNASWEVTTPAINGVTFGAGSGTFEYAINASNYYAAANVNARLMLPAAFTGTYQAGTTAPLVQRVGLTSADFVGTFHMGINATEIPAVSAQTGNWEDPATWDGGIVPASNALVNILSGHTVTVNAVASNAGSVIVNAGGALVVSGSSLTVGQTNKNNSLINNGTLTVSGGTLNINGNLNNASGSTFTQSGGTIVVDGNDNNNTATSVLTGTSLVQFSSGTVTLSGGTLRIVDPHVGTGSTDRSFAYSGNANIAASAAHTLEFGDGVSTDLTNNTRGFLLDPYVGSNRLILGNLSINTLSTTTNRGRWIFPASTSGTIALKGNLTITSGEYRQNTSGQGISVQGDVLNDGILTTIGSLILADASGTSTVVADTIPSTISGLGTYRNVLPSATISAGGSGYAVGDIITLSGGTFTTAAEFVVMAESAGAVTAVAPVSGNMPNYTVAPAIPASTTTTGAGNGCTLTWSTLTSTANFSGLTINNSKISLTGVTFGDANALLSGTSTGTVSGTFTLTNGTINNGGNPFILGTSATVAGTLSYTAGGFLPGNTFSRWFTTSTGQATITGGSNPSGSGGRFPFLAGTSDRSFYLSQTVAPTAGGLISVQYNNAATISTVSFLDGVYTVNRRSDANWVVNNTGITGTPAYSAAAVATGLYTIANANTRLTLAGAAANGSNVSGSTSTILPTGMRSGLALTDISSTTYYLGYNDDDAPFISVTSGDWTTASTWNKNAVPGATSTVTVAAGHTVTVNSAATAGTLTVAATGILTVSSSSLTVSNTITNSGTVNANSGTISVTSTLTNNGTFNAAGGTLNVTGAATTGISNAASAIFNASGATINIGITDNTFADRRFTNSGTLTVSAGNLNVYGNLSNLSGSTFNQSGGAITIDGNAGGNAANSVTSSNYLLNFASQLVSLTGGTITIVDPHANTTSTASVYMNNSTAVTSTLTTPSAHTIIFGNGTSTDAGGVTGGFIVNNWVGTTYLSFGNVVVNGPAGGTNRSVTSVYQFTANGNVTVNNGGVFSPGSLILGGDLTVNTGGTLTMTGVIQTGVVTSNTGSTLTIAPITIAQSIGGSGTYQNLATSPTASLTSMYIDNTSTTGVTLNIPLSLSGTLTLNNGFLNTSSANLLTLGTATAAGTLAGTPSATTMIRGPFARTFAASRTAAGTYDNTTLFPVGKGSAYAPVWLDPTTTAGGAVILGGEYFTTNTGTAGAGVTNLSAANWQGAVVSGLANLTGTRVQVSDAGISATSSLLQAPTATGSYGAITGVSSLYAAGPPATLTTLSEIAVANLTGFFAYGDLTPCPVPADQPTAFVTGTLTSTSIAASFTAAVSAPSNYLVVRYAQGATPTNPTNNTLYLVNASLGSGTVVSTSATTSFNATGLTQGAAYDFYVYSYNNSGCAGPVYNTTAPLTALNIATCNTGTPNATAATAILSGGFTANWDAVASATDYLLDVSTSPTFASFVAGYNQLSVGNVLTYAVTGLSPLTTYYYRVTALIGTCPGTVSNTINIGTAGTVPWSENFDALPTVGTTVVGTSTNLPTGWLSNSTQWSTTASTTYNLPQSSPNYLRFAWSSTNVDIWGPGLELTGGVNYTISFFVSGDGWTGWSADLMWNTSQTLTGATQLGATIVPADNGDITTIMPNVKVTRSFTPATTGTYFFGLRGNQPSGSPWYMSFDNFNVAEPCVAPTTQATSLNFPVVGSSVINGSFTAAGAPGATGYVVLRTAASTAPSTNPVDGTAYTAGATLGNATVVYSGTNTSFSSTGLVASTTYRFTVYAFNGNCGGEPLYKTSDSLVAETSTLGPQSISSTNGGGSWKNPATWTGGFVPSANDFVTITTGNPVIIDTAAVASTLTVNDALRFEATTVRSLTVGTDVTIGATGAFESGLTGTVTTHVLSLGGNLLNNGSLDFNTNSNTAGARITFTGATSNTFTANGTTDIRTMTINKGVDATSVLEVNGSAAITAASGFLTLTNGTLKVSANFGSNTFFSSAAYTIGSTTGFWLNNASTTVTGQAGSPTNAGTLRVTAGNFNVGTATGNNLSSSTGAQYIIEGGVVTIAGSFTSANDITYTQTAGTVQVSNVGNSSTQSFGFTGSGTTFNLSGGTSSIVLVRPNTAGTANDYTLTAGTVNITGGTLQFGNASTPASAVFNMRASSSLINAPSVVINNATAGRELVVGGSSSGAIRINGNLTINTGTTLTHNTSVAQTIEVLGDVTNNGTLRLGGSGVAGNTLAFTGTAAQIYSGAGTTFSVAPYSAISVNNTAGVTLNHTGTLNVARLNLIRGTLLDAGAGILLGAGAGTATLQRGGASASPAGSYSGSGFTWNNTGARTVILDSASTTTTTGAEFAAAGNLTLLQIRNPNGVTHTGAGINTTSLTLSSGVLTSTNPVTVTGTTAANVTRVDGWVNGQVTISLPASPAAGTYQIPVGAASGYAGLELINPSTSAAATVTGQYFNTASGGTAGIGMKPSTALYNGYWLTSSTGGFTSSNLRVTSLTSFNPGTSALAKSDGTNSGFDGTYNIVGTTNITSSQVTTNTAQTSLGYYAIGEKAEPMVYASSTTTQATSSNIYTNVNDQEILRVNVVMQGNYPPLSLSKMTFTANGSVQFANLGLNLSNAKLYYTGGTATFNNTTQIGGNVLGTNIVDSFNFIPNSQLDLLPGNNYFWLTYDVPNTAVAGDSLDATCETIELIDNYNTFANNFYVPTVTDPAGKRAIKTFLNGPYTIGPNETAPNFTTLTAAAAALNDAGVNGPVQFLLQSDYTGAGETYPITINQYPGGSAVNNLQIRPNTGATVAMSGSGTAIFKLNGADNVTIDGSNNGSSTKNLTITNTSTSSSAVIWVASIGGAGNGANNNTLKNLVIRGGSSTSTTIYGIVSSATSSLSTAASDNDNLVIQNNDIAKAGRAISALTSSTSGLGLDGLQITGNTIGNADPASYVLFRGIEVSYANNATISQNTIFNMKTSSSNNIAAIDLGAGMNGGSVVRNTITGIYSTSTIGYGAYGINFSSGTSTTNVVVANNMISDMRTANYSSTSTTFNAFGIRVTGGTNLKFYHNTIHFFGAVTGGSSAGMSANFLVTAASTGIDIRNNIFVNTQTFGVSGSIVNNVFTSSGVTLTTSNYNNYAGTSGTNTTYRVGTSAGSTARATLANWQSYTTQDANSKAVLPVFVSSTDLHLDATNTSNITNLANAGLQLAAVTNDFDGENRDATPTIGADELVPCAGAIGGSASTPVTTYCGSAPAGLVMTASGYSSALGGTYQWQSSPDNFATPGLIVNIAGATNPASYTTTSAITATTYYRLRVTCNTGLGEDFSSVVTITINSAPTATISATGGTFYCQPTPQSITLNAGTDLVTPAPVFQWKLNGTDINGANGSSYNPNGTLGNYTLSVTNTSNNCTTLSAVTAVAEAQRPTVPTFTPAIAAVCSGGSIQLVASSTSTLAAGYGTQAAKNANIAYPAPFSVYYGGQRMQVLVLASELSAKGLSAGSVINSIGFPVDSLGGEWGVTTYSCESFQVKLGATSLSALSTFVSGLTSYYGPTNFTPTVGSASANQLNLTSGFTWDGSSNLIIETTFSNQITGGTGDAVIQYNTPTSFNSVLVYRADGVTPATAEAGTSLASGFPSVNRPDFTINASNPVDFSWTGGTGLNVTNNDTVVATLTTPQNYTVIATASTGCTRSAVKAVSINPLPTITTADSAAFVVSSVNPQNTTLAYSATTQSPTTYSIDWNAAANSATFADVTNVTLPASPITINVPAAVPAGTYTGTISVTNANTCVSTGTDFTLTVAEGQPTWTGTVSSVWTNGQNWSTGNVPSAGADILISKTGTFNPVLTADLTIGGTLSIAAGNTLTIGGNTLTVTGGILANSGTLTGSHSSNLTLGATSSVRMASGSGALIKNLNVNAGTTTLQSAMDITGGTGGTNNNTNGVVTVANGASIASNGFLTFKSNISGTARLAQGATSGQWITGDVTVERYIPWNGQRAWRFLSVPTKGAQTIAQAWQERNVPNVANPFPGFGTIITSPLTNRIALGFDTYSAKASMQSWSTSTNNWLDVTTTNNATTGRIETLRGYAIYVRGDRSIPVSGTTNTGNATTLRTKGTLYTGDQAPISVANGQFALIGNTYASPIDFEVLSKSNLANVYYVWDPKLVTPGGSLGGYVTFSGILDWEPSNTNGSYPTATSVIQTGQAFMVQASGGTGSITLTEASKTTGNGTNVFRPAAPASGTGTKKMRARLYTVGTSTVMADANVTVFDTQYANAVDGDDAIKLANGGENLAIARDGYNLVVEGRQPVTEYDTTYFAIWNMRQQIQYRLEIVTENLNIPGLTAMLVDNFSNTVTPVDLAAGNTQYNFTVTPAAASSARDRFKIVYRQVQAAPVPVTFISISANKVGTNVKVDWKVAEERNIRQYEVERSADGRNFGTVGTVTATGNNTRERMYSWLDATPLSGKNYYRIKSVGAAGDVKYTYIVAVSAGDVKPAFTIAPNPVEGSQFSLQFKNQAAGRYNIRILANSGEALSNIVAEHAGGNSTQTIQLPVTLARGAYQLEIIGPDKSREVQTLFINTLK